jgi:hypothetical protein
MHTRVGVLPHVYRQPDACAGTGGEAHPGSTMPLQAQQHAAALEGPQLLQQGAVIRAAGHDVCMHVSI